MCDMLVYLPKSKLIFDVFLLSHPIDPRDGLFYKYTVEWLNRARILGQL